MTSAGTTENVPHLFDLTKMTGKRRNEDRTVFVATVEVERRTFWLLLTGLFPALILMGISFFIVGIWSLFVFVMVLGGWVLLLGRRRTRGLRVNMFSAMKDRKTSTAGKFLMCGQVIDPLHGAGDFQLVHSDAPIVRGDDLDGDGVADIVDPSSTPLPSLPKAAKKPRRKKGEPVAQHAPADILTHLDVLDATPTGAR